MTRPTLANILVPLISLAVVCCFFGSLICLRPVADVGVVVVADPAVAPDQRWFVRVLGIDATRRAPFVGTVNGVAVDEGGLVQLQRHPKLQIEGLVAGVALSLVIDVKQTAPPQTSTSPAPVATRMAGLLPVGDGLITATLLTLRPAAGQDVVVDAASTLPLAAELLVAGVTRALGDFLPIDGNDHVRVVFRLPQDAHPEDLVVVRLAQSPLPSARGRTLLTLVKRSDDDDDDDDDTAGITASQPWPAQTQTVSPPLLVQQQARRDDSLIEAARWRLRLRWCAGILLLGLSILAVQTLRRTPVSSLAALVVVALLLVALDAVLGFVG